MAERVFQKVGKREITCEPPCGERGNYPNSEWWSQPYELRVRADGHETDFFVVFCKADGAPWQGKKGKRPRVCTRANEGTLIEPF